MLWLAIRLPQLPLEVFPRHPPSSAVIAREHVLVCDAEAAQGGVRAGMRLSDAWALLPGLTVLTRDVARETRRLAALACRAGAFTSELSLAPPDALLLEVQGSLRLFGGVDALLSRVGEAVSAQGHAAQLALAPTPRAALWLAAGAADRQDAASADPLSLPRCLLPAELPERLAPLPLAVFELPAASAARLAAFGARVVGDVLRLPRAGLSRRLGAGFARDLAQALGELPDPRLRFVFPETFCERLELQARVADAGRLAFAAQRLIAQLCGWLTARSAGIAGCLLQLEHENLPASGIVLAFGAITRDPVRIGRVLRERLTALERHGLAAPATALLLQADAPEALPGREGGLFGEDAAVEGVPLLIERLQARLGDAEVRALAVAAEHRPEMASREVAPGQGKGSPASAPRPCWLLPRPQALAEIAGCPQHHGPLTLVAGPERIESGWWDAGEKRAVGDVRRDYFVARSPRHEWLWIFRDADGWFIHGIYA